MKTSALGRRLGVNVKQVTLPGVAADLKPQPSAIQIARVSVETAAFLISHEIYLRNLAADEQDAGEFTLGLSRCVDLLDGSDGWLR